MVPFLMVWGNAGLLEFPGGFPLSPHFNDTPAIRLGQPVPEYWAGAEKSLAFIRVIAQSIQLVNYRKPGMGNYR